MAEKNEYKTFVFKNSDEFRIILTALLLEEAENAVRRFDDGAEYFDICVSFRAIRPTTEDATTTYRALKPFMPDPKKLN